MLNYKEHPYKSSHARPDENSIGMFFCTFLVNIYPVHKYMLSYHFLYKLQKYENKIMYMLAIYCNYIFARYDIIFVGMVIFIIIFINSWIQHRWFIRNHLRYCCDMFWHVYGIYVMSRESLPSLSWVQWFKDNAFRNRYSCCIK
ncbi:hypothetical protein M9H77_35380 [Catharanthus roseus]|uniref:Uncharacterized protein n=1 Tax=Catharanthus roseus TaxID=4058 RepID=A0ACB9ZSI7_CATRO|nr:hypothetical protein M9H77_35380 [Catharanthus roseus]